MTTLLLATNTWDLTIDASGNIAVAEDPYATAQDVASACRLFLGELWYDTTQGIPYFQRILGKQGAIPYLKSQLVAAAVANPNVASAVCFVTSFTKRQVGGQLQLTLTSGQTVAIGSSNLLGEIPWYVSAVSPLASGEAFGP